MSSRFSVGTWAIMALDENATRPMRTLRGCSDTKVRAAVCRRDAVSVPHTWARMLAETSIARTIVARSDGKVMTAAGRAKSDRHQYKRQIEQGRRQMAAQAGASGYRLLDQAEIGERDGAFAPSQQPAVNERQGHEYREEPQHFGPEERHDRVKRPPHMIRWNQASDNPAPSRPAAAAAATKKALISISLVSVTMRALRS